MDKLFRYLPFHFLLALIFGICIQYFTSFLNYSFLKIGIVFVIFIVILFVLHRLKQQLFFTLCSFILFVFWGTTSVYVQDDRNYSDFYGKVITNNSVAIFTVSKILKPSSYYHKYEINVSQIDKQKTRGKVLLNIQKDSLHKLLKIDDKLFVKANFLEVKPSLNPHQFSYKDYLVKQGIYQQVFLKQHEFKILENRSFSLKGVAEKIRTKIQNTLKKYDFTQDEFGVINALLLGQRQEISKELLQEYSRAGAIHILAVSGLHVGIILLLLSYLFKPLERIKNGKYVKILLVVILLWAFAFIAGLSASVVRAVTMFTFVAIGQVLSRRNSVEYSLITSMFLLLLIRPLFIFDVGFQLSYLAVFGIVWIQPKLYNLWQPKVKILNSVWQLFTVSIGAQVAILPISLFYFHQFPSLFILSNLIIVPVLGAILIGGISVIILALLAILPQFLADLYGFAISAINQFISWISNQEGFVFQQLSMSFWLMWAWYIVILVGFRFLFIKRKPKQLIYFLVAIVGLQSVVLFEKYKTLSTHEFIVFHKNRSSILANRIGEKLQLFTDLDSADIQQQSLLKSYLVGERISVFVKRTKTDIYKSKNQQILVVDSLGVYNLNGLNDPIVLLQYSPRINLIRLISKLQPKKIIADGTNYKSYIARWRKTCEKEKTPFHYTGESGAFILANK